MPVSRSTRLPPSAHPLPPGLAMPGLPDAAAAPPVGDPALGDMEATPQPDGSQVVQLPVKKGKQVEHFANLAEELDESELQAISTDLLEKIRRDKEARSKRDEQYEEGLRRSGLGDDAPGGAQFTGASKVVHPMLAEASVDFESSAIKELFPVEGPVKPKAFGEIDQRKLELGERQQSCMNWMLQTWVPEFISELERVLTQLPMGGSQYQKFWQENALGRWTTEAVYIDDLYIPYSCADFWSASRVTHVQRLTESVVEERIDSGMYRDLPLGDVSFSEETRAEKASDKIEGRERIEPNVDNERPVFECSTTYKLSVDKDKRLPYLISIDDWSGKILSIYRNWEEDDPRQLKLHWIVDWNFIPWRGAYAIGIMHLIGGLSAAATGALRALLDSAHVNNIPAGLILKGWGVSGQTTQPQAGQFSEVQGSSLTTDDIRKIAMALPFNAPSVVLVQLLGWLTDAAKGVVTTAEEKISDAGNQMPVGTALALIESGSKVYSAIHKRLFRSMERALQIIARICAAMPDFEQRQLEEIGEILATRADFSRALSVQPASDPNVYSDGQRFAQVQVAKQLATQSPQMYNQYEVDKRVLQQARFPDIDTILPPPAKPTPMNAAAENVAALTGQPLLAFPDQAHLAHMMTHLLFLKDPMLGGSASAGTAAMLNLAEHLKQHVAMQYVTLVRQFASEAAGQPVDALMKAAQDDPRAMAELDQLIAAASGPAQQMLDQQLGPIAPDLTALYEQAAQAKAAAQIPHPDSVAAASLIDDAARKSNESAAKLSLASTTQQDKHSIDEQTLDLKRQDLQAKITRNAEMDQRRFQEDQQPGNQFSGV